MYGVSKRRCGRMQCTFINCWNGCAHRTCFFFSSRRRHTRLQGDWSSDVCSSDLRVPRTPTRLPFALLAASFAIWDLGEAVVRFAPAASPDALLPWIRFQWVGIALTRSEERRVGKSVDLGGRRIIKKKKEEITCNS